MFVQVIGAVFRSEEGRYLLLAHAKNNNKYTIPVGKVDDGETCFKGLTREMKEELGVHIRLGTVLSDGDIVCNRVDGVKFYNQKTWFIESYDGTPENLEPNKHPDMGWFTYDEIIYFYHNGEILERTVTDIKKVELLAKNRADRGMQLFSEEVLSSKEILERANIG